MSKWPPATTRDPSCSSTITTTTTLSICGHWDVCSQAWYLNTNEDIQEVSDVQGRRQPRPAQEDHGGIGDSRRRIVCGQVRSEAVAAHGGVHKAQQTYTNTILEFCHCRQ